MSHHSESRAVLHPWHFPPFPGICATTSSRFLGIGFSFTERRLCPNLTNFQDPGSCPKGFLREFCASLLSKCFLSLFLPFIVPQISHPMDFGPIQPELLGFLGSFQDILDTGWTGAGDEGLKLIPGAAEGAAWMKGWNLDDHPNSRLKRDLRLISSIREGH